MVSPSLSDPEQLDLKHERCVGRNHAAGATCAVAEVGWNRQLALAADAHADHALVPASDDVTGAERKAERFTAVFCTVCGSPLPRVYDSGIAVVPAGSLDHEPGIEPQARIFAGSRAAWSCSGDALPCHETYPEQS